MSAAANASGRVHGSLKRLLTVAGRLQTITRFVVFALAMLATVAPRPNATSYTNLAHSLLAAAIVLWLVDRYLGRRAIGRSTVRVTASQVVDGAILTAAMMLDPALVGAGFLLHQINAVTAGVRFGNYALLSGIAVAAISLTVVDVTTRPPNGYTNLLMWAIVGVVLIPVYSVFIVELLIASRDRARRADNAKTQFLGNLSHALRSYVNVILGTAELLQANREDDTANNLVRSIRSNAGQMAERLDELLDYTAIKSGKLPLSSYAYSPREVLAAVYNDHCASGDARSLNYSLELADDLPALVQGDVAHLRRSASALIANALSATTTGSVQVQASFLAHDRRSGVLQVRVIDSGEGVPPEVLAHLFNRNVDQAIEAGSQSDRSGLGLPIALTYARASGGDLGYSSRPNGGSEFWVTLAVRVAATAPPVPNDAVAPASTLATTSKSIKVLVVDDQPSNRMVFEATLKLAGHTVTKAADVESAVAALELQWPDVAIVDLNLPGSGLSLIAKLRERVEVTGRPPIPVIATTGDTRPSTTTRLNRAGASIVLAKPVKVAELVDAVATLARPGNDGSRLQQAGPTLATNAYLEELRVSLKDETVFRELVAQAIADMKHGLSQLELASQAPVNDVVRLEDAAHAVAGPASALGLHSVVELARTIETGAHNLSTHPVALATLLATLATLSEDASRVLAAIYVPESR